ncbi:MAG: TonB-dependent receptor [Asticcacaulis sp.]
MTSQGDTTVTAFRSARKGTKTALLALLASVSYGAIQTAPAFADEVADAAVSTADSDITEVYITARRRSENIQKVPISVSAVSGEQLESQGIYNVDQLTRAQPSIQLITSNPRNTATTIRGLGSTIGLTNDGLEPGVGIYVDDVYYARPGSAVVDLIDIERVEVLRGPQGTLFGKNTTAGALNITTRAPSFTPEGRVEASAGDYGFTQVKASFSGPLVSNVLAGRVSFGSTKRDGFFKNVTTHSRQNDIDSRVFRAQLFYTPSDTLNVRLSYDFAYQNPEANTQAFVRYGPTLRAANRQFPYLADYFNYAPPSTNPYDRLVDVNSPLQAKQIINGLSGTVNWDLGEITFTSISAYRHWDWTPQNDRDYTGLSIRTLSNNPSVQEQYSQEFRLASNGNNRFDWVVGAYYFDQKVETNGSEGWGADGAHWLIGQTTGSPAVAVPSNLIDGYLSKTLVISKTRSSAVFGQVVWNISERFRATLGLRYTHEDKSGDFTQTVSGGLATTDPALIAAKNGIARNQAYKADVSDGSPSGLLNIAYDFTPNVLGYVNYSRGYKSGGINAAGIPTAADGSPSLVNAVIDPEEVTSIEAGLKSQFWNKRATVNVAVFNTDIKDYQANVVDSGPGALRGYLANIEKVEVKGVEIDGRLRATDNFNIYGNISYTDAIYASFANGPAPLELQSSGTSISDLSGKALPGVSKWAGSLGWEYVHPATIATVSGSAYFSGDVSYRSSWNSDASVSKYAEIDASTLVNLRLGFRAASGTDVFVWVRNAFDEQYLQFTSVQAGNSGAIYGQPGDPRTIGVTVRKAF